LLACLRRNVKSALHPKKRATTSAEKIIEKEKCNCVRKIWTDKGVEGGDSSGESER